jgi:hypothetical protein
MTTPSGDIVSQTDGFGGIGTSIKKWLNGYFYNIFATGGTISGVQMISDIGETISGPVTTSAGIGDAKKLVALNSVGQIDSTMVSGIGMNSSGGTYQLTDDSTISIDWSNGNTQYVALSDVGRTITFSNPVEGEVYRLVIIQNGGSKTITTWPTIKWAAGSAPTLTITDGKIDIVTLLYVNSTYYADCNVNF